MRIEPGARLSERPHRPSLTVTIVSAPTSFATCTEVAPVRPLEIGVTTSAAPPLATVAPTCVGSSTLTVNAAAAPLEPSPRSATRAACGSVCVVVKARLSGTAANGCDAVDPGETDDGPAQPAIAAARTATIARRTTSAWHARSGDLLPSAAALPEKRNPFFGAVE